MQMKIKKATKRIPKFTSGAVRGGVYASEVLPQTYCYFFVIHSAVGIYPVASEGSILSPKIFTSKNWRWLVWPWMHFPQNSKFLGQVDGVTDSDLITPKHYQHFTDRVGGLFPEFGIADSDGNYIKAEATECLELPKYFRSLDLNSDMLALLPQMMVLNGDVFASHKDQSD